MTHRSATDLKAMLGRKYSLPEWMTFFEVPDAAGFAGRRRLDALAFNLYPSRGCQVLGFEVKASRSDWLKELKAPDKAEAFNGFCDRFYVVANTGDVEAGELPPTWGLIEPYGRGLRIKRQPETSAGEASFDRLFVAAMLKKMAYMKWPRDEVFAEGVEFGTKQGRRAAERELESARAAEARAKETLEKFNRALGVQLTEFNAEEIAGVIRLVLDGKQLERTFRSSLEIKRDQLVRLTERIDAILQNAGAAQGVDVDDERGPERVAPAAESRRA